MIWLANNEIQYKWTLILRYCASHISILTLWFDKPVKRFRKESDERDLQIRIGVSVDPIVGLDDDVALPVTLHQTLPLAGRDVQDQTGRVETSGRSLKWSWRKWLIDDLHKIDLHLLDLLIQASRDNI